METLVILATPQNFNDVSITFIQLIELLIFLGGIVGVWISIRVKITKIETSNQLTIEGLRKESSLTVEGLRKETALVIEGLRKESELKMTGLRTAIDLELEGLRKEISLKIAAVETKTTGLADFLGARYTEFVNDNKTDHMELKTGMEKLMDSINKINITVAKMPPNK